MVSFLWFLSALAHLCSFAKGGHVHTYKDRWGYVCPPPPPGDGGEVVFRMSAADRCEVFFSHDRCYDVAAVVREVVLDTRA